MSKKESQKQEEKETIVGISADLSACTVINARVDFIRDSNKGQSPHARPCDTDCSKHIGEKSHSKIVSDCGRCSEQIGCRERDSGLCGAKEKQEISKTHKIFEDHILMSSTPYPNSTSVANRDGEKN